VASAVRDPVVCEEVVALRAGLAFVARRRGARVADRFRGGMAGIWMV